MKRYKVYVNAGIEIWDEVEAENENDASNQAYALIGHSDYECNIEVTEVTDETK